MPTSDDWPSFPIALPRKGRGAVSRLAHRFDERLREPFYDGWAGSTDSDAGARKQADAPAPLTTQVSEEQARSILARNDSPDISFDTSINPYRGCEHGCIYCFARPTHGYLNLSPGLDFETRLVAKVNAAQRLTEAFSRPGYRPSVINIGSATDAYQPVERRLRITRSLLEVMQAWQHPFSVVTKSSGIERDLDLLVPMAEQRLAAVYVSLTSLDAGLSRILEPRAASPQRRLKTIRLLSDAGVPVGVSVSPIIPFINEPELERILEAAAEAGARSAFSVVLRLPWEVSPLFREWLQAHFPQRAARVMARIQDMRGGRDYQAGFGSRMRGEGVWAELLAQRFRKAKARLGLEGQRIELDLSLFRHPPATAGASDPCSAAPAASGQLRLF